MAACVELISDSTRIGPYRGKITVSIKPGLVQFQGDAVPHCLARVLRGEGDVAKVVESVGGCHLGLWRVLGIRSMRPELTWRSEGAYTDLRRNLGRVIHLGLGVFIIGDIIRTILVEPTLESVGVLAAIVLIRIVLSF